MASTNKTAHYEFPQYIGSDIPNILTDINPAFETIDTALYEQGQQIAEQTTDLSDIQEAVDQATADVAIMQSSIVQMAGIVETTRQLATDNKETIGQGTLDTTAQTLIGGVNELNEKINPDTPIASVTANGSKSYATLLSELFNQLTTPLTVNAYVKASDSDLAFFNQSKPDSLTEYVFIASLINASSVRFYTYDMKTTGSAYITWTMNTTGNTTNNYSDSTPAAGLTLSLYDVI